MSSAGSRKTAAEIAHVFSGQPNLVSAWKRQALEALPGIFQYPRNRRLSGDADQDELYGQIGQLKVELDFVKKKELACSVEEKRRWIQPDHSQLTIEQQCALLGPARSSYYYHPRPESQENRRLLRRLDELYMEFPYYRSQRLAVVLFWIKDKSLTDTNSLPPPDVLATEIADDLEAALDQFTKIAARLTKKGAP